MTTPAPLRTLSKNLGLRSWVDSKDCERSAYFDLIESLRSVAEERLGHTIENVTVYVTTIAAMLEEEGSLYRYLTQKDLDTADESEYQRILTATAYVIIERYNQAIEEGTWPPQD